LFRLDQNRSVLFYVDIIFFMNAVTFDAEGQVISQVQALFAQMDKTEMKILKLEGSFVFYISVKSKSGIVSFRKQEILLSDRQGSTYRRLMIKTDEQFNFIKHQLLFDTKIINIAANSTRLLKIDLATYKISTFDSYLNPIHSQVED
jgi:hypothetical protein